MRGSCTFSEISSKTRRGKEEVLVGSGEPLGECDDGFSGSAEKGQIAMAEDWPGDAEVAGGKR